MDGGAWWAAVHGVMKSRTRLRDFTFTFHFHALEKEMATHSSVLAWRIPGMGEPGGLPSMELQSQTRLKRISSSSSSSRQESSVTSKCKGVRGQIKEDLVSYRKDLGWNLNAGHEETVYHTMILSLLIVEWANCI